MLTSTHVLRKAKSCWIAQVMQPTVNALNFTQISQPDQASRLSNPKVSVPQCFQRCGAATLLYEGSK